MCNQLQANTPAIYAYLYGIKRLDLINLIVVRTSQFLVFTKKLLISSCCHKFSRIFHVKQQQ